jgi:alanine racemase
MPENDSQRPTWAEINLDNLAFNLRSCKKFVGDDIKIMAVVKADAYGHGAVPCSERLEAEGVDWFGVALPEEGVELRNAGIQKPVLCLGGFWQGQENLILNNNLTPVVYRIEQAESLDRAAKECGETANIHVKIDTGMGRIGVRFDDVTNFAEQIKGFANLRIEGLMTHFAAADNLSENAFTDAQISKFQDAVETFRQNGFDPAFIDLANSPGAVAHPNARGNMVRLGGVLYGLGGDVLPAGIDKPELNAVLSLHSKITHIKNVPAGESLGYGRTFSTKRDSLIATIPIGYHDGYRRSLSNTSRVIVNGVFAPVVGRISMDWTIIDVTDVPDVKVEDEVILIGSSGGLSVTAEELAAEIGTISYEITCGLNRRVRRQFQPE